MKIANVVSVRDAGPLAGSNPQAPQAAPISVSRMSDALRRYPEISEEERQQLIQFLKHGAQEDIVQATYVVGLEPRLIVFQRDHPEHFPRGLKAWGPFAVLVLVPLIAVVWHLLQ
jgi:hypothetical protein